MPSTPPRDHETNGTGVYRCAACGALLFRSEEKFDAGTGFPSFRAPIEAERVAHVRRDSHGVHRIQACCAACGAHLGHRFGGDAPRYCLVSDALVFEASAA